VAVGHCGNGSNGEPTQSLLAYGRGDVYGHPISRRILPLALLIALATAGPAAAQVQTGDGKTISAVEGASFSGVVASFNQVQCPCSATIDWGDGGTSDGTVSDNQGTQEVSGTHTYAEEGSYKTEATLKANNGNPTASGTANVADAPLTATGVAFSTTVGDPFSVTVATFTDADPGGVASDYQVAIDWGDGSTSAGTVTAHTGGGFDASAEHTYATAGSKTVTVTVTDAGGASATATAAATVGAGSGAPPATTPAIITALGSGAGPNVRVFGLQGSLLGSFFAYDPAFTGGVFVAAGDLNGDKRADIVTGAGAGGGPHVKVFNGIQGNLLKSFFAYDAGFQGGVRVAVGDVNGDGVLDIITGAGAGGGPHVKVFNGIQGNLLHSFDAFDAGFTGGVFVAAGDVNGDGRADVIVGAGAGGGPHVKVFNGVQGNLLHSFDAFDAGFTGGVTVAAGDVNGDGNADVIVGAGAGGGPHVKVFNGVQGNLLHSFDAFEAGFTGGVNVAGGDVNGDGRADVIVGAGPGGGPHVRAFSGNQGSPLAQYDAYSPQLDKGVFVAVGAGFLPAVQRFRLTHPVFRVANFSTPRSARAAAAIPRGTAFRYVLNGSAKVRITIAQPRVRGKRLVKRGTLRRSGKRGPNSVRFSGRIGRRALAPGRYRATISTGRKAPPRRVLFRIVAG
jgi:FG-GAP-like repeat/FG-GAP repeat